MIHDPIVEEVRAMRDAFAREFGYDIDAIFQELQRLEATSQVQHVSLPARRVSSADAHDAASEG